jgi:hypothetical protein
MSAPHGFTGQTLASACRVLTATLSYQDRPNGDFTRIDCITHSPATRPLR